MKLNIRDCEWFAGTVKTEGQVFHRIQVHHIPTDTRVTRMGEDYNVVRLRVYKALREVVEKDETSHDISQLTG